MGDDGKTFRIARARRSLQVARANLDDAVRILPEPEGDNVMATPALLGLLLHAVTARRHLNDIEVAPAAGIEMDAGPTAGPLSRDQWP